MGEIKRNCMLCTNYRRFFWHLNCTKYLFNVIVFSMHSAAGHQVGVIPLNLLCPQPFRIPCGYCVYWLLCMLFMYWLLCMLVVCWLLCMFIVCWLLCMLICVYTIHHQSPPFMPGSRCGSDCGQVVIFTARQKLTFSPSDFEKIEKALLFSAPL